MALYIGIDPGLHGGIVALGNDYTVMLPMPIRKTGKKKKSRGKSGKYREVMEIDWSTLSIQFRSLMSLDSELYVCLELVHALPQQGVVSMFTFGGVYEGIRSMLETLGIVDYMKVSPQQWQKMMFVPELSTPITLKQDPKIRAKHTAHSLWPTLDFTNGEKKDHDGLIDAALIARYGMLYHHRLKNI